MYTPSITGTLVFGANVLHFLAVQFGTELSEDLFEFVAEYVIGEVGVDFLKATLQYVKLED